MERHRQDSGGEQQQAANDGASEHDPMPPATEEQVSSPEVVRPVPRIFLSDDGAFAKDISWGRWLDATDEADSLTAVAQELMDSSPFPNAAVSVRYHDGFEGLAIAPDEDLATVNRLAHGVATHGRAFVAYVEAWGRDQEAIDRFADYYQGSFASLTAWAEQLVDDFGWQDTVNRKVPPEIAQFLCFDYERLGREMTYDSHVVEDDERGEIHVFRLHG